MNALAIEVKDLGKCYRIYDRPIDRLKQMLFSHFGQSYGREFWALSEMTFQVKKGETIGIIGRNGSGKSTLLQLICGTLSPSTGYLAAHGRIAALLELGSGFNAEFTGRENVYLNASILGLSVREVDRRFDNIAAFANIGEYIDQPVKTYSSGMMVRLAFAVVAHVDADILVIDEALAVGDAFFTQKCMRYLREFMKSGTVLFVSHDTVAVKNLCNRAIWMEKGRLLQVGSPKEVCESYLQAYYEGNTDTAKLTQRNTQQLAEAPLNETTDQKSQPTAGTARSEFQIFEFSPESRAFGQRGAQIVNVQLLGNQGTPMARIAGGEEVSLRITAKVHVDLDSPVVGFFIKDRLGQFLFGDNTYQACRERSISCQAESEIRAQFIFTMPLLPSGDYSICAAIANGTQENHVQHHWLHDAVIFKVLASNICLGLFGVQMKGISLEKSS